MSEAARERRRRRRERRSGRRRERQPESPAPQPNAPASMTPMERIADKASPIKKGERYQAESGWLDKAVGMLDFAGNISRSAILGAERGGLLEALEYADQAFEKKRYTDPTIVKDILTQKTGLGKVRYGRDDKKFQMGDVLDFGADLLTDIATDPITWVTFGASAAAKQAAGQGTKAAAKALKAGATFDDAFATGAKIGAATTTAEKVARAGIGASYGLGATDRDADLSTKLMNAATGAGLVYALGEKGLKNMTRKELAATMATGAAAGVGQAGPNASTAERLTAAGFGAAAVFGASQGKKFGNAIADMYAEGTRGSKYSNFSEKAHLAQSSVQKTGAIAQWIMQGRYDALKDLDDFGKIKATNMMKDIKTEFLRIRQGYGDELKQLGDKYGYESKQFYKRSNEINKTITEELDKPGGFVQGLIKDEETDVVKAIEAWTVHNNDVIKRLNKETGKDLVGLKYHIDDIYAKADIDEGFKASQEILDKLTIHRARSLERSGAADQIEAALRKGGKPDPYYRAKADDITYGIYAEAISKKFLNKQERAAVNMMREYGQSLPKQVPLQYLEKGLKGFDKMTSFMKAQMLYFSLTWLKSNYWDNMMKAFVESGAKNAFQSAGTIVPLGNLKQDILQLYGNNTKHMRRYRDPELMNELLEEGVLEGTVFKTMTDDNEDILKFMMRPKDYLEYMQNQKGMMHKAGELAEGVGVKGAGKAGELASGAVNWWTKKLENTVGRFGSYMEGYSRAATYKNVKDALRKAQPGIKESALRRQAADITKKTFFDYGDVTYFEKAVMKRIFPFYSFYSKNLPYWMDAITNPKKAGRVLAFEKGVSGIGENPTEKDKMGFTDFVGSARPRLLGKKNGEKIYAIFPTLSMHDAIKMVQPGTMWAQIVEKSNPYFKVPVELAFGTDTFTGGPLYPSSTRQGKKYIFSRGFKWHMARQALSKMGVKDADFQKWKKALPVLGALDVAVDKKGNPIALDDWNIIVDKVLSTVFPTGAADQIMGSVGKTINNKETLLEAISNRIMPGQTVKMSKSYERLIRGRKKKEQRERRKRRRIQQRTRRKYLD